MKRRTIWGKDYEPKPKPTLAQMRMGSPKHPRRKFTDNFVVGDEVYIIRSEHGWYDGRLGGKIKSMSDYHCVVHTDEGYDIDIDYVRDIRKAH